MYCGLGENGTYRTCLVGDELYNYLLDHGALEPAKVQKIFTQLVGAVSYVHMQSCVHRDLKLENILLDRHENVKLVDFGFTREYEGRTNHLQTFCGTICYAAPEMLKGEKYAGEKVDVWSLGIILYALLCGELPFDDDDDNVTRTRILSEEPTYPDRLPAEAVSLIKSLLSKRPLPRPSLAEILMHPFLFEYAPAQRAILEVQSQPPFSTALEKDCLQRMRSAGVDIDAVIESVLAQKCDTLSGWWTLLLQKEERKARRREKRRKEKEADSRSSRRLSAASSRLERIAPILQNVGEESSLPKQLVRLGDSGSSRSRGRSERRSAHYYADFSVPELPLLPEASKENGTPTSDENPPTPIEKDSIHSVSTSRHRRPVPPPKEGVIRSARSRGSTLHLVTSPIAPGDDGLHGQEHQQQMRYVQKRSKLKPSEAIASQWKNWTHWLLETTTKRRKGHGRKTSRSAPDLHKEVSNGRESPRPQTSKYPNSGSPRTQPTVTLPKGIVANGHAASTHHYAGWRTMKTTGSPAPSSSQPHSARIGSSTTYKRQSLSPSPLTSRSGIRRSSAGLRGRKSTSSSVSSVRSIHRHHQHSHSKASSTSSAASVSTSRTPLSRTHSPHHSVKVLPATPTAANFPSNIRLVRGTPASTNLYDEGMPGGSELPPPSPSPFTSGFVFAKRKRNLFKGPTLNFGMSVAATRGPNGRPTMHSRSTSASGPGRRSGEVTIHEEEEEDQDAVEGENEDVEEVAAFGPLVAAPGESIETHLVEEDETTPKKNAE